MQTKIGIVGLPNVGKSTLFKALTKKGVEIANYPFTTINPNVGVVSITDERLERIVELVKPSRFSPAVVEFVDIAGLIKGASRGEGLGNQFLSYIFGVDAILFLVRCFVDKNISSSLENPNPDLEFKILKEELAQKDEELKNSAKAKKEKPPPLLLAKPYIVVGNIKNDGTNEPCSSCELLLDAKLELDALELSPQELEELKIKPKLPELISLAYKTLGLITFYTIKGGEEVRAWPLKNGTLAPEAGGIVHTDFKEKFIRAEVINFNEFIKLNDWNKAKEIGKIKLVGRDYIMQDGDIIEFKI